GSLLLGKVENRIGTFIERHLGLQRDEAYRLQKAYFVKYGNTLVGLMHYHGIEPEDYLAFVNDIDVTSLPVDPRLRPAIARLPGRRFVFTNNCVNYAQRVLKHLELDDLVTDVWDIRSLGFKPKPDPDAYQTIIRLGGFAPQRA